MDGMQIVALVIFMLVLVAVDIMAMRGGFDSRYSWDSPRYEHPRTW